MLRSMIDHKKVLVLALNGPAVGGGAAWFEGVADIVLAADSAWLQVPFSALGLVPEFGSATSWFHSIGAHRTNDFLMFGRKLTAQELEQAGMVNRIFPTQGFHKKVIEFLQEQLEVNDGKSMMEMKRLQNLPLRRDRMLAVYDAAEALAERFVEDAPKQRFAEKNKLLMGRVPSAMLYVTQLTFVQKNRRIDRSCSVVEPYCGPLSLEGIEANCTRTAPGVDGDDVRSKLHILPHDVCSPPVSSCQPP
jgi:Delta3-Delta2-enoyl-CoA isomerase